MVPGAAKKSSKKKHLFLIDGYGFVFRAYHSLPPLTRPDGTPVGAVYGFTNMIMKLKHSVDPVDGHHMLVVLDAGRKTFRNDIYPEYKANRPPAPEDLIPQFPLVHEAARALGLATACIEGYEADDIIATYARMAKEAGMDVTVVSSDKDLMQLVGDGVEMYDAMKDRHIGPEQVEEKFGVGPDKVLDVLSLMGDSSDNIPGVPGIGPKTATELITTYGSLDDVLARAEEVKQNKRRESLIAFADQARLSRELVTLCDTVPVEDHINTFTLTKEDPQALLAFLQEQGFKSLVTRIEKLHGVKADEGSQQSVVKKQDVKREYTLIQDRDELVGWLSVANDSGKLVIHMVDEVGIAFAHSDGCACYVPLGEKASATQGALDLGDGPAYDTAGDALTFGEVSRVLRDYLEDASVLKIGHDIKTVMHHFDGMKPIDDTLVTSYVLDGSKHKHDLSELASLHLDLSLSSLDPKGKTPIAERDPSELKDIFCAEADAVFNLQQFFRQRLFDEHVLTVYETIERKLIPVLATMEKTGVKVDAPFLKQLSEDFTQRLNGLEQEVYALAGHDFNVGSPKQLGEVLFDEMGIEGGKKSKKSGAYATDAGVLEELAAQGHTIAEKVLAWRELSKLKNTYTEALVKQVDPKTGRIHTTFAQTVANTGRLSSVNPNLQNIPIRSEEGRKIREAFVAEEGHKLISADYSQIELRLLAHIADIDALKEAFSKGGDLHALTASQVFGVPLAEVDAELRRRAKAINFGIIYGQSAFGLAASLGISRGEASEYIQAYFEQYPGIRAYMDEMKEQAHQQGYVTTLFIRKCFLPSINSKGPQRAFAERAAINAPLQGTAADLIKRAMIRVDKALKEEALASKMILQVHDELLLEAPDAEVDQAASLLTREMEHVIDIALPIPAEAKIGANWNEAH